MKGTETLGVRCNKKRQNVFWHCKSSVLCSDSTEVNINFDINFSGKSLRFIMKNECIFLFALHDKPMKI